MAPSPPGRGCFWALRSIVFLLNLLFWLSGLFILALGLWLLLDRSVNDILTANSSSQTSDHFPLICYLLIGTGILMALIGGLGCCGAWRLNQGMLVGFFIILLLVFCLQLVAAILAYSQQEFIKRYIDQSMYRIVQELYATQPAYKELFDNIQSEFKCCGVRGYRDWLYSSWGRDIPGKTELGIGYSDIGKVPQSCCNEQGMRDYPTDCGLTFDKLELRTYEPFMHSKGCSEAIYDAANSHLDIVIAVCVIMGTAELVGMFLTMLLCCWLNVEKRRKANL
ncbi:Tetraspanin family protein [Acanthocheilonema viteae]